MLKHWEKLRMREGVLYRETRDPVCRTKRFQLVLLGEVAGESIGRCP